MRERFALILLMAWAAIVPLLARSVVEEVEDNDDVSSCDGMAVPNGVVRCSGRNSCVVRCDYGFSPVKRLVFVCEADAEGIDWGQDEEEEQQDESGCAANMAFVVGEERWTK